MELPGLIDCHVHFREPGLEHKADMLSEGRAARAGGVFTVCEMPNTTPGTNTVANLQDKIERAKRVSDYCDLRFYFGATTMDHVAELERLLTDDSLAATRARCCGLKLYLDNSTGDMKASEAVTEAAFQLCAKHQFPLVAHCEHAETNNSAAAERPFKEASDHSVRRPAISEVRSVEYAVDLARKYKTRLHIAHTSTAGAVEIVKKAKRDGFPVTCEVTPHHLFLTTADYGALSMRIKVNPPIRVSDDCEALWTALLDGSIDCIGTDHAPHLLQEKQDPENPPSGMPGVELVLRLLLTVAVARRWPHPTSTQPPAALQKLWTGSGEEEGLSFCLDDIKRTMFTNPNTLFSLGCSEVPRLDVASVLSTEESGSPASSSVGAACRMAVVDEAKDVTSKCKWSPYNGWCLVVQPAEIPLKTTQEQN